MSSFIVTKSSIPEYDTNCNNSKQTITQRKKELSYKHGSEPFIGVHISGEHESFAEEINIIKNMIPELNHVQLFTHGPANIKPIILDPDITNTLKHHGVTMNVHGSYLSLPWRSLFLFKHTMENFRTAHSIGAEDVVLHIPYLPIVNWLPSIVKLVHQIKREKLNPIVSLETSATIQHYENSFESPAKLNRLWRAIKKAGIRDRVGFCIDTAHIHASGMKIRNYKDAKLYLDTIDPECMFSIQLNGNCIAPGTVKTRDMHEIPLHNDDLIWGGLTYNQSGCRAFIEYATDNGLSLTVEWNRKRHSIPMLREFIDKLA
jgi:endonuclease IV